MGDPAVPVGGFQGPLYTYPSPTVDGFIKAPRHVWCFGDGLVHDFNTIGAVYPGACHPTQVQLYYGQLYSPSPPPPPPPPFHSFCQSPYAPFPTPWLHHWLPPVPISPDNAASNAFYTVSRRPCSPEGSDNRRGSRRTKSDVTRGGRHGGRAKPEALTSAGTHNGRHLRRNSWGGGDAGRGNYTRNNRNCGPKPPGLPRLAEVEPGVPRWQAKVLAKKQSKPSKQNSLAVKSEVSRSAWDAQTVDSPHIGSTIQDPLEAVHQGTDDARTNDDGLTPVAETFDESELPGEPLSEYEHDACGGLDVRPVRGGCARKQAGTAVALPRCLRTTLASAQAGLDSKLVPVLTKNGTGGAYVMRSAEGAPAAIFKPEDEEPCTLNNPRGLGTTPTGEGLKKGVRPGEGAVREVAAYLLDHAHFAGVPPTVLVCCRSKNKGSTRRGMRGPGGIYKVGSLQKFVATDSDCEEIGASAFTRREVHKICVLDMRLANADRNGSNILACRLDEGGWELTPIDHGYCLPDTFEEISFEWKYWRQAKQPFGAETLKYISKLDAKEDLKTLEAHGITLREGCRYVFRACTSLLKKGAAQGLTPFEISNIMCREALEPSPLETLFQVALAVHEAKEFDLEPTIGLSGRDNVSSEDRLMAILDAQIDKYLANDMKKRNSL